MRFEKDIEEVLGPALFKKLITQAEEEHINPGALVGRLLRDALSR